MQISTDLSVNDQKPQYLVLCVCFMDECVLDGKILSYCLLTDCVQGKVMNKICQAVHSGLQGIKQRCHQHGSESFFSKNYCPWNEVSTKPPFGIRQTHDMLSVDFVAAAFHLTLAAYAF